jgi:hypothetical protein
MPKYKLPADIQRIARNAIEYNLSLPMSRRAAYKDEDGKRVPGTGMRTARRLASGAIDEAQMKLMSAWFARHGESEREAMERVREKQKPDKTRRARQQLPGLFGEEMRPVDLSMPSFESWRERDEEQKRRRAETSSAPCWVFGSVTYLC